MERNEIDNLITYYKNTDLTDAKNLDALFQIVRNTDDRELNEFVYNTAISNAERGFADSYDIYLKSLLYGARYDFDKYMLYLEHRRPPEERFYLPRRDVLLPAVKAIQALIDDELDEIVLSMPPRVGKALANDTPILTRNGWKKHGDLVVGDEVVGINGKFKKVIYVHPKCQLDVLIEFSNGEKIQCHERHEWRVFDKTRNREIQAETKVLESNGWENNLIGRGRRYNYMIPTKDFVVGEHKELSLDPYTLGVWLGDGSNRQPRITGDKNDYSIIERIIENGNRMTSSGVHKTIGVMHYDFDIRAKLRHYGLCHSRRRINKFIPEEYLTASVEQRLMLLAGLIDTDGTLSRKENRYQFVTAEKSLADSFVQLISTFGWRACVQCKEPKISTSGIVGRHICYSVGFNPTCYIPCALERKKLYKYSKQRRIAIKNISRVEPKEGNCITVEGDGMYLAGNTMLPTHNTSLLMFLTTFIIGKFPEKSNLYSAFSDSITNSFYKGVLEVLGDAETYAWGEIFPTSCIAATNSAYETLDIDRKKRYASLTCRSLYGTLNGACDCNGFLMADDLLSGIEEARSPDRLDTAWMTVTNNLLPRCKRFAKMLWCGTRWSQNDPAGRRIEVIQNEKAFSGRRIKVINMPALNKEEESNFDYKYGVGFKTQDFKQIRAMFERGGDMASWLAQYMGAPIERQGTVFAPEDLKYFNGELPCEASRIYIACDPAFGGGDFVSAPVCAVCGEDVYVIDVVYSNLEKDVTQAELCATIMRNKVTGMLIECTKTTMAYKEGVEQLLEKNHTKINIETQFVSSIKSKNDRIMARAPEIRQFHFLEEGKRSKQYSQFMQNVYSYTQMGKNKHDDAPDSLAIAVDALKPEKQITVMRRFM